MQNSRHQLKKYWSIFVILTLTPFLLWVTTLILPTFDDWTSTTHPDFNPFFIKERFLFYGYHWRPFDTFVGYIVGQNPQLLYPTFNHCLIVVGHVVCAIFVYQLLNTLRFSLLAKNIATLYFFIVPATMATVTAIDSMNQVYSLLFGIISFLSYIKLNRWKYPIWITIVIVATWWKENGLMWALITPILAYGFDYIDRPKLKKDLIVGFTIAIGYALAIILLPKDITIHPEYVPEVSKIIKNFVKFVFTTFVTIDYIYLLHENSRNLLIATLSFLFTLPFIYYIYIKNIRTFINKKIVCSVLALLIAVAPHIGTVFSMMHTYAGLAMVAIIIAYSIDCMKTFTWGVKTAFLLFFLTSFVVDIHLIKASISSGLVGKKMAVEAIHKTDKEVKSVFLIIIEDDYTKLSSFCVIPYEAFGWGLASKYETNYKWPEQIQDTIIERKADSMKKAYQIANTYLNKYDCIWIVNHNEIKVLKKGYEER